MQIAKLEKVTDVILMEEKLLHMGKQLSELRDREYTIIT